MLLSRRIVLHVDDDPMFTRLAGAMLERGGYESESIHNPLEAIDAIQQGQHRIVLLDIHMPKRSGLKVLSDIKALDAGIQVIMLTGLVNETTILEAMHGGARQCLFKPVTSPEKLIEAIDDAWKTTESWWRTMHDLTERRKLEACALSEI